MQEGGHHGADAPGSLRPGPLPKDPAAATARDVAPGVAAIATRLAQFYGFQEQHAHWSSDDSLRQGGKDPLEGVSAFASDDHWHYISYGLSELYEDDRALFPPRQGESGFGFELTFRLKKVGDETQAPPWPVGMLQRLARYVFRSGNVFRPGDHMDLNGPIGGLSETKLTGALFTPDTALKPLDTRYGAVNFLQVVGVTDDELEAVKDWRCEGFLEVVARTNAPLVTDPPRPSLLEEARFLATCQEGARQEGSAHGSSFASVVRWIATEESKQEDVSDESASRAARGKTLELTVGAIAVPDLMRMLTLRLPFNRPFRLHGRKGSVHFVPGLGSGWQESEGDLVLSVPWDAAAGLAHKLKPLRGRYAWPGMPGVTIVVEPTDVRGSRGELVRVIG